MYDYVVFEKLLRLFVIKYRKEICIKNIEIVLVLGIYVIDFVVC